MEIFAVLKAMSCCIGGPFVVVVMAILGIIAWRKILKDGL